MEDMEFSSSRNSEGLEPLEKFMEAVDQLENYGFSVQIGPDQSVLLSDSEGIFVIYGKTWLDFSEIEKLLALAQKWKTQQFLSQLRQGIFLN
jgi:hypothetical protein